MRGRTINLARTNPEPRRTKRGRTLGFLLVLAIMGLVAAPQALAADRAHWADGYVWAYDETATSYDASASNSYAFNRTGRSIMITRPSGTTGRYLVRFRGLSALLGARSTVHVTGYDSNVNYCTPMSARLVNDVVDVRCYNANTGAPQNGRFDVYVTRNHADLAFAYANRPTAGGYSPAANGSWNPSAAGGIKVSRSGTGTYAVNFKGLGTVAAAASSGGHVQVNPVAAGKAQCKVVSWGGSPNLFVTVACYTRSGTPVDAKFNVQFLLPSDHLSFAWANNSSSASYTPSSAFSSSASGGAITATRSGTGEYAMTWTGNASQLLDGGNVEVTAYGGGTAQCKTEGWSDETVFVRCFTPTGVLVDSQYTVFLGS
jgi:hypothetical protein